MPLKAPLASPSLKVPLKVPAAKVKEALGSLTAGAGERVTVTGVVLKLGVVLELLGYEPVHAHSRFTTSKVPAYAQ